MDPLAIAKLTIFKLAVQKDYPDAKIVLFGSRAREDYLKTSDFDVVIITEKLAQTKLIKRMSMFFEYWKEQEAIEVFCYTQKEFDKLALGIGPISTAAKEGIYV
jgi:predicted nucleotidyltransferase